MNKEKIKQSFKLYVPPILMLIGFILLTSKEYEIYWLFIVAFSPLIGAAVGFLITAFYRLFRPMTQIEFSRVFIFISILAMCGYLEEGYYGLYRRGVTIASTNKDYVQKGYLIFKDSYRSYQYLNPDRSEVFLDANAAPAGSYYSDEEQMIWDINKVYESDSSFIKIVAVKFYPSTDNKVLIIESVNEQGSTEFWRYKFIRSSSGGYDWTIFPYKKE